jgi:predicted amidohydrolase
MARYVTVSCLAGLCPVDTDVDEASLPDILRTHWTTQLAMVLPDRPDLIVLPEYSDLPRQRDDSAPRIRHLLAITGETLLEMLTDVARRHRCNIAYPTVSPSDDGERRNTMWLIDRAGEVAGRYDKNHVTVTEHDEYGLAYGRDLVTVELDFGTVAPAICWDLNFPELLERHIRAKPDLVVFASAWHGGFLQQQWAYACGAYLTAAVHPPAPSAIVSPLGEVLASSTNLTEYVTRRLNLDRGVFHLDNVDRLAAAKRRYGPAVRVHDPGLIGSVLVTAETDDLTVADLIDEFDLEPLNDFFVRSRRHRDASGPGGMP